MTPDRAVEWMSENGRTCYADMINALQCTRSETIGDAGRYWQLCEFTQATLRKIDAEIEDVKQRALDRYEDWASD
jgi:hypothetical protein